MPTTFQQAILVFQKNWRIYVQEKQYIGEFAAPFICFVLLISAKHSNSQTFQSIAVEFLPMSLLVTCRSMVTSMISEKSERQKEIQKIMGLSQSGYMLGWFMTNLSKILSVSIFFLLLIVPTSCLKDQNDNFSVGDQIGSFLLYGLSLMSLSYFITTLFDVPKSGADLSVFLNIIGSICSQLITLFKSHELLIYIFSFMPSFCYDVYPYIQLKIADSLPESTSFSFTKSSYFMMLGVDILLYGLLYLYLDQVLPNEYGTNKHPLFFLGVKQQNSQNQNQNQKEIQNNVNLSNLQIPLVDEIISSSVEDFSSAPYHEIFDNIKQIKKAVYIDNLQKLFPGSQTKAVDGVSLSIYESQILCLLGHNGAGKTTTISLLTGLITKDMGNIYYYGKSMDYNLEEIRTYIGICPQKDVVYGGLTVDEHLWYYGSLKGVPKFALQQEINQVIIKCALSNERTKLAKNLSGGNRRKLCLAMALIGGSKVIFLDEPTSGMDPVSRKKIWDILIQMKNEGKCLVLTTHHLDEAEILSERIAVMAKGKLLTVGSVDFVKKNFGIGYHLNIYNLSHGQNEWEQTKQKIKDLIYQQIPEGKLNPQTSEDCLSYQLPFDKKQQFLPIFKSLENDKKIQINLMMNTLEEAFINIGMDEEQFLKKTRRYSQITQEEQQPEQVIDVDINAEFAKIIPPQCSSQAPKYIFSTQLYGCFLRKLYAMQGKRLVFQFLMPTIFMFLGPIISLYGYQSNSLKKSRGFEIQLINCGVEVLFGICIASSNIGAVPVMEREQKQKYAMNVMGCRILPYWISNYIFDMLMLTILIFIYLAAIYIFQQVYLQKFDQFFLVYLTFLAYVPLAYLLQWMFTNFLTAVRFLMMIQMFGFYLIPVLLYFVIPPHPVKWIFAIIFPSVSMAAGFEALYYQWDCGQSQQCTPKNSNISKEPWIFMLILVCQAIFYFSITLIIDSRSLLAAYNNTSIVQAKDEDVLLEAQRVAQMNCQDRVISRKISKTYANGYQAVKGTSFGVEPGTIFGLLGPNGAGKSTTFNMITSRLKPSTGQILLEGTEIKKGMGEVYQNVGICPQFDSLFETLTPIQHLTIWAYLKGLSGKDVVESVDYFMKVMQLTAFAATQAGQLSGGNKRKLCVALALMGGTNMQFFDEPSSGVDPIARRFLWNAIQQGVKLRQSAVILTTHTMDEAEGLCSKIAIQVNGQFACMGTPQHLKQKFGEGYRVTVEPKNVECNDEIIKKVKEQYPDCVILNENQHKNIVFKLCQKNFQFYSTFSFFLERLQNEFELINDFQINESNLEQVFMHFASVQEQINTEELPLTQNRSLFASCCGKDEDD